MLERLGGWEKLEITTRYRSTAAFNQEETSAEWKEWGGGESRVEKKGEREKEREERGREQEGRDELVEGCGCCRYTLGSGGW